MPAACCIIDELKYPAIEPVDGHCIYVPTKYNSHWTQVRSHDLRHHYFITQLCNFSADFQGCLSSAVSLVSDHLPFIMLGLVLILALQMVVIVTALCLCCLPKHSKTLHTILVPRQNDNRPGIET